MPSIEQITNLTQDKATIELLPLVLTHAKAYQEKLQQSSAEFIIGLTTVLKNRYDDNKYLSGVSDDLYPVISEAAQTPLNQLTVEQVSQLAEKIDAILMANISDKDLKDGIIQNAKHIRNEIVLRQPVETSIAQLKKYLGEAKKRLIADDPSTHPLLAPLSNILNILNGEDKKDIKKVADALEAFQLSAAKNIPNSANFSDQELRQKIITLAKHFRGEVALRLYGGENQLKAYIAAAQQRLMQDGEAAHPILAPLNSIIGAMPVEYRQNVNELAKALKEFEPKSAASALAQATFW